jgi:hypothetical protein
MLDHHRGDQQSHVQERGEERMGRELGIEGELGRCRHEWRRRRLGLIHGEQD